MKFDIYRWLDNNGKYMQEKCRQLLNFSWGQRNCPGQMLAYKRRCCIILSNLFQGHKFSLSDKNTNTDIKFKLTQILHIHPSIGIKVCSIGCEPCTRAIKPGEDSRAGRWWWEQGEHKSVAFI